MRVVHTFFYNGNKSFRAWELTVWLYYLFLRDTESALEQSLHEYNNSTPQLTETQLSKYLDILFNVSDPLEKVLPQKTSIKKSIEHHELDFHLHYIAVCKQIRIDSKISCQELYLHIIVWNDKVLCSC